MERQTGREHHAVRELYGWLADLHDAWGHPIVYRKTTFGVTIASPGPDGKSGTADDQVIAISNDGKVSD